MKTHATSARTVVDVNGAVELLHRVVGAADRRNAAQLLRAAGRDLDLGQARAVTMDEGRSVVIATAATGAALAVRWFAPGEATTVHDHGSWGAAVVLEGALRYERFDDVVADVCVPAWRFQLRGREQVLELLTAEELGQPNQRLTSFRAWPMPEGVIIEVAVRFADGDGTKAWRALHVLRSCAGRIVEQVTYCTGHWDAAAIAAQEATAPMVRP
jgi:hypothetical protein